MMPRNVYQRGKGYRGQRMIAGRLIRTRTCATPELAAAALAGMLAPGTETACPAEVLTEVIAAAERTTAAARRALVAFAIEGESY